MDTLKIIASLEDMVEDATKFLGFVRMDEDRFFQLVSKLRASLPDDLRKVSQLAEDADRIRENAHGSAHEQLENARTEAEKMLAAARAEVERLQSAAEIEATQTVERARDISQSLIDQSEIARIATAQAREIIAQADSEAQEIRAGADAYAHEVLLALESHIQRTLNQFESQATSLIATIQRGRQELEKSEPTSESAPRTSNPPQRRNAKNDIRIAANNRSDRELVSFGGRR